MSKQVLVEKFNITIKKFFKQIVETYPQVKELKTLKSQVQVALMADETIAITNFYKHLVTTYESQILKQDEKFFLSFDLSGTVLEHLNHLKVVYTSSSDNTKSVIWKYCKVLTILSKKYST